MKLDVQKLLIKKDLFRFNIYSGYVLNNVKNNIQKEEASSEQSFPSNDQQLCYDFCSETLIVIA
jgi:hypothetical protein